MAAFIKVHEISYDSAWGLDNHPKTGIMKTHVKQIHKKKIATM